jgi:UDP-glucose 4-epimerase
VLDISPEMWRKLLPQFNYSFGDYSNTKMLAQELQGAVFGIHLVSTTIPSTSNVDSIIIHSNL